MTSARNMSCGGAKFDMKPPPGLDQTATSRRPVVFPCNRISGSALSGSGAASRARRSLPVRVQRLAAVHEHVVRVRGGVGGQQDASPVPTRATPTTGRSRDRAGASRRASPGTRSWWPSGSRKYTDAAGIQPMTLGSVAGSPKKESGWTPMRRQRRGAACRTSSRSRRRRGAASCPAGRSPATTARASRGRGPRSTGRRRRVRGGRGPAAGRRPRGRSRSSARDRSP